MKSDEVKIGGTYRAKVSDKLTTVRIDAEHPSGGWRATNLITNMQIRIKSAQRLRGEASVPGDDTTPDDSPGSADAAKAKNKASEAAGADTGEHGETGGKRKKKTTKKKPSPNTPPWAKQKDRERLRAQHKADQENARVRDEREAAPDGMTASERAMAETESAKPEVKPVSKRGRKRSGTSLLDAAITVLRENGGPMTCSQMIEQILEKQLWSTSGKTPAQTLYSAILRELQKKGADARFTHVERGKFDLTDATRQNKEN